MFFACFESLACHEDLLRVDASFTLRKVDVDDGRIHSQFALEGSRSGWQTDPARFLLFELPKVLDWLISTVSCQIIDLRVVLMSSIWLHPWRVDVLWVFVHALFLVDIVIVLVLCSLISFSVLILIHYEEIILHKFLNLKLIEP